MMKTIAFNGLIEIHVNYQQYKVKYFDSKESRYIVK